MKLPELVFICDFLFENYTTDLQDKAQSYHWASQQVTIHHVVSCFNDKIKVEHVS